MSTQPTAPDQTSQADVQSKLADSLRHYWGFDSFRDLQFEAMQAVMQDRDSLVVFPTGGGKSLCFQAPAVCRDGMGVVVSPLISLMKDQVDSLVSCGIKAAFLNSSLTSAEESQILEDVRSGNLQLLYLAPERLLTSSCKSMLKTANVRFFAIDEAHCVSQWGHDFRPEYRGLKILKTEFPTASVHAYTATATEQVRGDILQQLGLENPEVLVGSMRRSNLNYQIRRRQPGLDQIVDVLRKHESESGIVYCISRKDVEKTSAALNSLGFSTLPYHAGISADQRKSNQDAFLHEDIKIIVATVAFGMGIDKSNVRFVVHASMPKSLEAYQQESGRAGRDGLDAECWLFFNGGDYVTWKRLIDLSNDSSGYDAAISALDGISKFCNGLICRHVALAAHFDEVLKLESCDACDVCLDDLELVDDPLTLAQKIVSCVFRVDQRFGADYVAQVLTGSRDKRILQNKHDQVSTYGLLDTANKQDVRTWVEQLIGQDFLIKSGEYNIVKITDAGRELLRGEAKPRLTQPLRATPSRPKKTATTSWEGVDKTLFELLRTERETEAKQRQVPAYVVFSDASLRDMARRRPSTVEALRLINGVGQQKLETYGVRFLGIITDHCETSGVSLDESPPVQQVAPSGPTASAIVSFEHFEA
ncbi:MAG: ATP-dependent DNA helicase RecQ, partial [Mariniblastus sp.]